jgi:hypothetical protein
LHSSTESEDSLGMPNIPAFIEPPKKQGFFSSKSTNIQTPEPLFKETKKPGLFSRFFAPKPAPKEENITVPLLPTELPQQTPSPAPVKS